MSALLVAALNEPVYATIDGHRRTITKRAPIVAPMVSKSAKADLRAAKMRFDMMKEVEQKAGRAPPPEPAKLTPAEKEVVEHFMARLRRQIAAEAAEAAGAPIRPLDRAGWRRCRCDGCWNVAPGPYTTARRCGIEW